MTVSIVHPAKISKTFSLSLPGETMAYTDAPIFAQTSGYLHKWNFDIGAKVKAGDILAEIDTPEIDQQLNQARAQLKVAQSARDLSEATYKREKDLFDRHVIANQVTIQRRTLIGPTRQQSSPTKPTWADWKR